MMETTRASLSTQKIATTSALALVLGGAVLALQRGPATLVLPAACPGAAEWIAIAFARVARSAPLGIWLLGADRVLAFAAVMTFAVAARRSCRTWLAAAATALAFAAQPAFAPRLSILGPAAVLVPAVVVLVWRDRTPGPGVDWRVWLGLLTTAALAPGATLPLAIVAGWCTAAGLGGASRRWLAAVVGGSSLLVCVAILEAAIRGGPPAFARPISCVLPWWSSATAARAAGEVRSMLTSAGAFACSLAGLGAFSRIGALRERISWTPLAYALASVAAAWIGADPARLLMPAMVGFWVLVAVGLAEAVRACRVGIGGRFAAGLLVVLLPLLQVLARSDGLRSSAPGAAPNGHERLALQGVAQLLRVVPADTAFVIEDATLDLLLRALDGTWQRSGKTIRFVEPRTADVSDVLGHPGIQVFAFPAAQNGLWRSGFRLTASSFPDMTGVAAVRDRSGCTIADTQWRALPGLRQSPALALVAETEGQTGPIAVYLSSDRRPSVRALDWPPLTIRGFTETSYDLSTGTDRTRIEARARQDGVPSDSPVLTAPFVTRLELWRTPGAPRALAVELGVTPVETLARLRPDAPVPRLTVCPVFSFAPQPLTLRSP